MKKFSCLIYLLLLFLLSSCGGGAKQPTQEEAVVDTIKPFKIGNGVNVSHWLSQSDARGEVRANQITKKDFDSIAAMGFDFVRIPIDEVHFYDENMNRDNEAFQLLQNAIVRTICKPRWRRKTAPHSRSTRPPKGCISSELCIPDANRFM